MTTTARSPWPHAAVNRMPHDMLAALAAFLPPGTPPAGPDGPIALLERRIAELLGTQRALFFPSGTMAQQTVLRVHAERSGRSTFGAHPQTHVEQWEERGYAVVHGLRMAPIGDRYRLMDTAALRATCSQQRLAAVLWELPQRDLGGLLPQWDQLTEQVAVATEHGAAAHLDGARLWESQPFYGRPHAEIAGLFDSVYVSLYKGLGGVRGAVLAGRADVLDEAAVWRRRLGGAITDAWPLAAWGLLGLDVAVPRMAEFHRHAIAVAAAIEADGAARAVPNPPQTPLFHVHLPASPHAVETAAAALLSDTGVQLFGRVRTGPDPQRCAIEFVVGEPTLAFTPAELVDLLRDLLTRAR